MNDTLKRLEEQVIRELQKIVEKGDMSPSELEVACKAVCLLKELGEYNKSHEMNGPMGFSEMRGRDPMTVRYMSRSDGMGMANGGYYMGSYGPTYEYAMPMPHTVAGNSYGYSGHSVKDRMYKAMERELENAQNDQEKDLIRGYMREFMAE